MHGRKDDLNSFLFFLGLFIRSFAVCADSPRSHSCVCHFSLVYAGERPPRKANETDTPARSPSI
jgi:hypothetical protein